MISGQNESDRKNECIVNDTNCQGVFKTLDNLDICDRWTYWNSLMFSFSATTTIGLYFHCLYINSNDQYFSRAMILFGIFFEFDINSGYGHIYPRSDAGMHLLFRFWHHY